MPKEITLPHDVRCFQKQGDSGILFRAGRFIEAGSSLTISDPETLTYDHRDQQAVSFVFQDRTYYMLVSEINVPELVS